MPKRNSVAISFGSNLGDRVHNLESALKLMRENGLDVKSTSFLYETKPMYYEDQDPFLNGVCHIETDLQPIQLLDTLQAIENRLGRVREIFKGPRTVDLDIALYNDAVVNEERLQIPHMLLLEREFVLRPLNDILERRRIPPSPAAGQQGLVVSQALQSLKSKDDLMSPVTVLSNALPYVRVLDPARKTHIMAILNVTPDSFSDGGVYSVENIDKLKHDVRNFVAQGASIIDIGGQSTRPSATLLSADQELERVIPVIRAIREIPEAKPVALSVDTFYSKVAREAVAAGADIINDISAGSMDDQMLLTVAKLEKTIILMHMRGTPETMMKLTQYPDGVIEGITSELAERVQAALKAGIHPWRIILDPGIGFAKTTTQNVEVLTRFNDLRGCHPQLHNLPWLSGPSRKGFIGKITGVQQPQERTAGTAVAITASIAGGADIVRVHDVAAMAQVAKMADAMYRRGNVP